jgi:hypothetical protein
LALAKQIASRLIREKREPSLRMSNMGKPCKRQLWYEVNGYDGEEFRAEHYLKFLYGDIIEELLLFLAEQAGHTVEGRQDELEIEGIKGHRDAVIDGLTVDVKSASSYSFRKFKEGLDPEEDAFGYLGQLGSYVHTGRDDPLVTDKSRGAFLVADKTLGHITLDVHDYPECDFESEYAETKRVMELDEPPDRGFQPEVDGKSGNLKLGVNCSYCAFKETCYPELRTFLYSTKPVYLVKVVRTPNVPELLKGENGTKEKS